MNPVSAPSKGLFVPSSYQWAPPSDREMNTASIIFGITLGISIFTASKAARQTLGTMRRSRRFTAYVIMIWGHWASNMGIAPLTWFYLRGIIYSSFWLWFVIVVLWCFQVQLLMQIIINRVSLLMAVRSSATRLKWTAFIIIGLINISVFVIWIPANLQISETWIHINSIWDRTEKCIFLILDASLNCYFVYLVRTRLIANGLTKYNGLFRFNVAMIFISVSLDAILVGLMSLPNHIMYLQFQCTAYMVKLSIEMNMADLIRKVVKASNDINELYTNCRRPDHHSRSWPKAKGLIADISCGANNIEDIGITRHSACVEAGMALGLAQTPSRREAIIPPESGIRRTIQTDISVSSREDEIERCSIPSSKARLKSLPAMPQP